MSAGEQQQQDVASGDIAIVGLAGRFPGAEDVERFWTNLCDGVESVREFSDDELDELGVPADIIGRPDFVRAGAVLTDADAFDHAFWGYSPREAELMDPQQRLFLETAWHAFEHAGYDPLGHPGMIGVFAGMGLSTYLVFNLMDNPAVGDADTPLVMLGNDKDFLSTRVSYHLNLRGPSIAVQSGCSTSLVATHLACDSLLSYQCDMALVGGSTVAVPQRTGYLHVPGGTASPDGHSRAFDAEAAGTLFGSGVGAVVLKRLEDALADRDTVYAVIKGSAINNDGSNKIGFTAPSIDGQAEVVARAQQVAGVDPRSVSYVETHGTATRLGDPMEIAALTRAFRVGTSEVGFCAVGSVKTNVGHLDTAAGVAGLIKTTMALHRGQIPPSLNFRRPNPQIDFANSPFYVNTELSAWPESEWPARAGVSAFGFGGTNAHLVLEQGPTAVDADEPAPATTRPQVLVLSAKTPGALDASTARLADFIESRPDVDLADIAHAAQRGRAVFEYRRSVVVHDRADAVEALRTTSQRRHEGRRATSGRPVAFLLPGLGDQYVGMAHGLYANETVFRESMRHCARVLTPLLGVDPLAALYPAGLPDPTSTGRLDLRAMLAGADESARLRPTTLVHPTIFAVEWSLAQQWLAWGVRPSALLGHSMGEYVAATLAGVFRVEDALTVVAERARMIDSLPHGAMLVVPLNADETAPLLGDELTVALVNSDKMTVVSGPEAPIGALEARLTGEGLACRRLESNHAFHSPAMAPIVDALSAAVARLELAPPTVPFLSNVTGTWITAEQATDPAYWGRHTVRPVRFAAGLAELCRDRDQVLLEVGPGQSLSSLATAHLDSAASAGPTEVFPSMRAYYDRRRPDDLVLRDVAGQLWVAGVDLDWAALHAPHRPRRVAIPGYPFERTRAWIAPPGQDAAPAGPTGRRGRIEDWLLAPGWRSLPAAPGRDAASWSAGRHWLVLGDDSALTADLVDRLGAEAGAVTLVERGDAYARPGDGRYRLDPAAPEQYARLLDDLARAGRRPDAVLHLWSRGDRPDPVDGALDFDTAQRDGFYSLAYLGRALGARAGGGDTDVWVLTEGTAAVDSTDVLRPATATVLAPAKCIPQEYEGISVRTIDVPSHAGSAQVVELVLDTMAENPVRRTLAVRGTRRWEPDLTPLGLGTARHALRPGGVYVITGGLGQIGLRFAEHLGRVVGARLVLVGRSVFPPEPEWSRRVDEAGPDDPVAQVVRRLLALREAGAQVRVHSADASQPRQLRRVLEETWQEFGAVDGVVHCAGIGGAAAFGLIEDVGPQLSERQFTTKVRSCYAIAEALDGALDGAQGDGSAPPWRPDVVVLISSNAALLGGLGGSTYTACNLFVDNFAEHRGRSAGAGDTRWISVNLEEWLPDDGQTTIGYQTSFTQYAISAGEGVDILQRVMERAPGSRVTVVTGGLRERVERWIEQPSAARHAGTRPDAGGQRAPRPELGTPYAAPVGDDETTIAEIWAQVLGVEQVGRDDNFYELGGHSLLATQIVARVTAALSVQVSLLSLFQLPTVAGLAANLGADARAADRTPVPTVPRTGPLRASFAQRRFWFLDQMAPGNAFYNIPDVVRIDGPLDVEGLAASVNAIVARHEALRTTLHAIDAEPVQVVADHVEVEMPLTDLGDVRPDRREDVLRQLAAAEAGHAFDLARGPLVRAEVVRFAPTEHVLLLTMHHSVSDAWSTGIFVRELATLYEARQERRPAALPTPRYHYADFAAWQHEQLRGGRLDELVEHWRGRLDGAPPLLALPTDFVRPAAQSFRGAIHPITLPQSLIARLGELSARNDSTLFMTLFTAFNCLLHLVSGERDIVVGSPIAGRTRPEFEDIVGAFVNMLPLRVTVDRTETFRELLARVRAGTLDAYTHQDLPFEVLVESLAPERDLSRSPIFQVAFVLQNAPLPELTMAGLRMTPLTMPATTARFDLMVMLRETGDGAVGTIEFATDLFREETIARFARSYAAVLEQVVADPDRAVGQLDLVTADERAALLAASAGPEPGPGVDRAPGIVEMIAEVARATPEVTAVTGVDGADSLDFATLDARSELVARALRRHGVGIGSRIGLHLDRDPRTVAILLAVFKAGAAYVALDPAYPRDRLAYIAADAGLELVVSGTAELPFTAPGCPVLVADELWDAPMDPSDHEPLPGAQPGDPAFVIYTSGSTGGPKGVLGPHGGMLNRLRWMWARYPFVDGEVHCQKTSLNFLDSFWEIFGPLCQGVPIVVVPHTVVQDPARLVEVLAEHAVTRLVLVPSLLRAMLDAVPDLGARLPALRTWVTSGEALPPALAGRFCDQLPDRLLLNLYGSSEVSADVTAHAVVPQDAQADSVPIGRPIASTNVRLLDERLRLVPPGAEGDVYVGGPALARCYLRQPAMTAERFVPDPFASGPGERLYRTGDRARMRADGVLEYAGRRDDQVKVRGFRIELAEVERAIALHPAVDAAAVVLRDEALVAYLGGGAPVEAADLRKHLLTMLPGYAVPSAYVTLDALPLTPSGKLDRPALAGMAVTVPAAPGGAPSLARTPVEQVVAGHWAATLDLDGPVDVEADFFVVGGHSLLATRLVARVGSAFGVDFPLQSFFENPTARGMAAALLDGAADRAELERRAELLVMLSELSDDEVDQMLESAEGGGSA